MFVWLNPHRMSDPQRKIAVRSFQMLFRHTVGDPLRAGGQKQAHRVGGSKLQPSRHYPRSPALFLSLRDRTNRVLPGLRQVSPDWLGLAGIGANYGLPFLEPAFTRVGHCTMPMLPVPERRKEDVPSSVVPLYLSRGICRCFRRCS